MTTPARPSSRPWPRRFAALVLVASIVSTTVAGQEAPVQTNDLVFVYIHGFGGLKKRPRFCANLQEFLDDAELSNRIINYEWDSVRIEALQAGASWIEAQKRADEEGTRYHARIIEKLERERTPYVLVGFSIGSRVVLRALEESGGKLDHLRGVFFMGAAMTRDTTLKNAELPDDMKIFNYHSEKWDIVHQVAFAFMSHVAAGGMTGFADDKIFRNYAVSCTHTHKGVGVHIDYSQLAVAIAYISLYREGVVLEGDTGLNLPTPVGTGDYWWNKVWRVPCRIDGKLQTVEIEQNNMVAEYFRALRIDADGGRKRIARGDNLHAILEKLNAEIPQRGAPPQP